MAVINFEIFKVIGTLSEDKDGWKKGITLSLEELIALRDILNESDLEAILAEAIEEKQASKE
ncbi:MAG: hypothetical protein E6351_02065 [Veillonella sp.]|uniref:hypothetical protein n=1 Tax=Veillonella sp. TaxID=1926307 RepID=UPI0029100B02|nr:hypothetical protein [Veillonella sp.]MDU6971244.1 hypothetical protein [Veillonella sp.]